MSQLLTVSPSPHAHSQESIPNLMFGVVYAMIPAALVSFFFFGLGAVLVLAASIAFCLFFEWAITKYMLGQEPRLWDGSALLTGALLAFNVPTNLPLWILAVGALVAVGVGKMSFGGLGQNLFNPALVGRVFMLIAFPVQMTSWPLPVESRLQLVDVSTGPTVLSVLKEGVKNGESMDAIMAQVPSHMQLFYGHMGGSMGEIAGAALLLGLIYMLYKRIITWHTPVAVMASTFVFTGIFWLADPSQYADPLFHLLTGGLLLGAIFMATDYVTSPMHPRGMLVYGVGIGLITTAIRLFGAYPEGISFAILIMNAFVPIINKYIKPKRYGEKPKPAAA